MFSDIRCECNTSPSPLRDGFSRIRSRTFSQFGCGRFSLLPDSMVVTFYFHLHSRLAPPLFPHFRALARHVFLKLGAGAHSMRCNHKPNRTFSHITIMVQIVLHRILISFTSYIHIVLNALSSLSNYTRNNNTYKNIATENLYNFHTT